MRHPSMRRPSLPATLNRNAILGISQDSTPASSATSFTTPTPPPASRHLSRQLSNHSQSTSQASARHRITHAAHAAHPHPHAHPHYAAPDQNPSAPAHAPYPNPHIITHGHNHLHGPPRPHIKEEARWRSEPLVKLPYAIAYFLGHRRGPQPELSSLLEIAWAFIGIVCSISLIAVVTERVPLFKDNGAPVILASFGAAAVLEFYAIASPFAQPRNALLSQIIASVIGVAISKLFALSPHEHTHSIRWVGGALSCGISTAIMAYTGTVHPPAGATALLAVVDKSSVTLGWYFIPLVLLSSALMFCVALLVNNIQRRFPVYWWSPKKEEPIVVIQGVRGNRRNSEEDAMESGEAKRAENV